MRAITVGSVPWDARRDGVGCSVARSRIASLHCSIVRLETRATTIASALRDVFGMSCRMKSRTITVASAPQDVSRDSVGCSVALSCIAC